MVSLSQLMSSSKNPIRQVVHIQVRSRVVGGRWGWNISGISVEFSSDILCKLTNCVKFFCILFLIYLPREYLIPAVVCDG